MNTELTMRGKIQEDGCIKYVPHQRGTTRKM